MGWTVSGSAKIGTILCRPIHLMLRISPEAVRIRSPLARSSTARSPFGVASRTPAAKQVTKRVVSMVTGPDRSLSFENSM